jgi:hypothetical protein
MELNKHEIIVNIGTYSITNLLVSDVKKTKQSYEGMLIYSSGEIIYQLFFKKKIIREENTVFHILYQSLLNGIIFDDYTRIFMDISFISGGFIIKNTLLEDF